MVVFILILIWYVLLGVNCSGDVLVWMLGGFGVRCNLVGFCLKIL